MATLDGPQIESMERGQTVLQRSSHPVALIFQFLFRTLAVLMYLFGLFFTDNFIFVFVLCILLLAFDFWTVKNVTGRLLVGLRWWNQVVDGKSQWMFESKDPHVRSNAVDSNLFWASLYIYVVLWALMAIASLVKPTWLIIDGVAIVLNMSNLIGYTKCDKDAKKKIVAGLGNSVVGSFISNKIGNIF